MKMKIIILLILKILNYDINLKNNNTKRAKKFSKRTKIISKRSKKFSKRTKNFTKKAKSSSN